MTAIDLSALVNNRNVRVSTPLPPSALLFEAMRGEEQLGRPFAYEVDLLGDSSEIELPALLGKGMTVHVDGPHGQRHFNGVVLDRRRMRRATAALMREFDVRPADPTLPYGALSGGNQQKALLAKWFQTDPRLLLLDEPTQGVDVGARLQIFELIRATAREQGVNVLCASSDYEQLASLCDRVIVFGRGRVWRQLVGSEITKDRIIEQCYAAMATEVAGVVA